MSTFTLVLLCVQACLVQNIYTQCIGAAGPLANRYGLGYGAGIGVGPATAPGLVAPGIAPYTAGLAPIETLGAYGGSGIGDVVVVGEMPVTGTTLVAGQVPILGTVRFAGDIPASGTVTISGSCGCGCGANIY